MPEHTLQIMKSFKLETRRASPLKDLLVIWVMQNQDRREQADLSQGTFIIPAPKRHCRMVPQSHDVVFCFCLHVLKEFFVRWVHAARELEILPDKYAQLCRSHSIIEASTRMVKQPTVTCIIEYVGLIYTSSPQPDHILVTIPEKSQPSAVTIWRKQG